MTRDPAYKRRMSEHVLLHRIADLGATIRFLSRLPLPQLCRLDDTGTLPVLPRAAAMIPLTGFLIALKGFVAAIIGGLASYPVAALGALIVGLLEAFASFWASAYKEVIVFTLIIPVLLWRSLNSRHVEEEE